MIDKVQAEELLQRTIKGGLKHKHYKHVTEYADELERLITGKDIEKELKKFVRRENDEDFNQRVALSQIVCPSIASMLISPARKIGRVRPMIKKIDFEVKDKKGVDQSVETKISKLNESLQDYYAGEGLDSYIDKRIIPTIYVDPNSFQLTTFNDFDSKKEKAEPFPTIINSHDAINYEYLNNKLLWLIVKRENTFNKKVAATSGNAADIISTKGNIYWIYVDNDIVEYAQVDEAYHKGKAGTIYDNDGTLYFRATANEVYQVSYFEPKAGQVQAIRVGALLDEQTDGETCISPIHAAIPYLKKSIKAVSELDMSITLHVFLQKLSYQPPCKGESETVSCNQGRTPQGNICSICDGEGYMVHKSSQDTLNMRLPRNPDEAFQLDKLIHYQELPIDIVEFLGKFCNELEGKAIKAVYNSDVYVTNTVVATATEKVMDMQSVYDALYPIAEHCSRIWVKNVELIAAFTDLGGVIAQHQYPKDFKYKSTIELLAELQLATNSGAPQFIKQEISNDIAAVLYQDRPNELKRLQTKQLFNPFDGKTESEINFIISNDLSTPQHRVLWAESSSIFTDLEMESKDVWFYDLSYDKQKPLVDAKVEQYLLKINESATSQLSFNPKTGLPDGATTV